MLSHDAELLPEAVERLELVLGGPVFFQTLRSAVELDLFTLLARQPGASLPELCELTCIASKPMRILLLGCTALGLISREGDAYQLCPIAQRLLNRDHPGNIVATIEFTHHLVYRPMFHMLAAVTSNTNAGLAEFPGPGDTLYERLSHQPELERVFQQGLQASSAINVEQLLTHYDFTGVRHLLDIGGGTGTALCAIASRLPQLTGTVFESPTVCELAREYIHAAHLSDRVGTHAGNSFTDPFPAADCILFMHFLTIWSESANRLLLQKSFDALPSGGRLVIFDGVQANDRTGPLRAARWSPYFLVLSSGQGMFYTADENADWLREAGFVDVRQIQTGIDHAVIAGRKP